MTTPSPEVSLATIEQSAKLHSADRDRLSDLVTLLDAQIQALKSAAIKDIKKAVARAAESQATLAAQVDQSRHLFIKPRTLIFWGIKCGLRKGKGGINWEDDAKVVQLIEKFFPKEQAELLIKTTKKPIVSALEDLDVATLKKLGCTIQETGDLVVVSAVDSAVDKLVTALLKDAVAEATTEAA